MRATRTEIDHKFFNCLNSFINALNNSKAQKQYTLYDALNYLKGNKQPQNNKIDQLDEISQIAYLVYEFAGIQISQNEINTILNKNSPLPYISEIYLHGYGDHQEFLELLNKIKKILSTMQDSSLKNNIEIVVSNYIYLATNKIKELTPKKAYYKDPKGVFPKYKTNFISDYEMKLTTFLSAVGEEENLSAYVKGLCNAFAFMQFRAELIGEGDKNVSRMYAIMESDDKALKKLGQAYYSYRKRYRELISRKGGQDELSNINRNLDDLDKRKQILRKEVQENKTEVSDELKILENEIKKLREHRDVLIGASLRKYFANEWEKIEKAKELYFLVHTLVASFGPEKYFFRINGQAVNQNNFLQLLHLLPPDAIVNKKDQDLIEPINLEKIFCIAYSFNAEELKTLFERTVKEDDLIRITFLTHAVYLSNKNGQLCLYDPLPIYILPNTFDKLVRILMYSYSYDPLKDYMPITIDIYQNVSIHKDNTPRLDPISFIEEITKNEDKKIENDRQNSAAWMAAKAGNIEVIRFLMKQGFNFNNLSTDSKSPYHAIYVAACKGHADLVSTLIEAGADVNAKNKHGVPIIYKAAENSHLDVIEVLARAGADINATTKTGISAMHIAAKNDHANVIEFLAKAGADINKQSTGDLITSLHIAVGYNNYACIKMLLAYGARTDIQDKKSNTPMDYANNEVKAYVTLQMLKKYINDNSNLLPFAETQLQIIAQVESNGETNWHDTLINIIDCVKEKKNPHTFFQATPQAMHIQQYIAWFVEPTTLYDALSKANTREMPSQKLTDTIYIK